MTGDNGVYIVNEARGFNEDLTPDVWIFHQARCWCTWQGPLREDVLDANEDFDTHFVHLRRIMDQPQS